MNFEIGDEVLILAGTKQYMIEKYNESVARNFGQANVITWVSPMDGMEEKSHTIIAFCQKGIPNTRYHTQDLHAGFNWRGYVFFIPVSHIEHTNKVAVVTATTHRI